jgi:type I site-specific restriction endonuclease
MVTAALQIWSTTDCPVLAPKKDKVEDKNRRDYATEKWEAEVRASQLAKRAASGGAKLSKADQAAVAAQLAKEAEIRAKIASVQAKLQRGMQVVRALVSSNASQVEKEVGTLAKALLASVFAEGAFLLDESAFEVFLVRPRLCAYLE